MPDDTFYRPGEPMRSRAGFFPWSEKYMKRMFWMLFALLVIIFQGALTGCSGHNADAFQFRSSEIEAYTIVYAESNPDYFDLANQLADRIYAKYGKMLQILPDVAAAPAKYEILLGDTNRYDHHSRVMEYSVTVGDGKFRIHAGGSFSAEKAVSFLCEKVFNGQELTLASGEYYRKSLLTKAYEITNGTTARIMTANVLADAFADSAYHEAYYRAEIFAGMLVAYTPDVLGLQETDESWNAVLEDYLVKLQKAHGITYTRHWATYEDKVNYTSLLYRSDKFKIEDSGVNVFSWWKDRAFDHDYHMRNISWARFSSLEDASKQFVVANTHWSYRTEHADGKTYLSGAGKPIAVNQLREQCKNETDTFLSRLKQMHPNMPVFLTGDFNTSLTFFTQSGWTPRSFRIISEEAKKNNTALSAVPDSGHYDHIFGAGNYSVNRYAYFKDTDHLELVSDHPFAYADVSF